MPYALIFDCDGVLVDTERSAHLVAFNRMWREFGVPWAWTVQQYAATLHISGGMERLDSLRSDPAFRSVVPLPATHDEWLRTIRAWHRRKTEIYIDLVRHGRLTVRPGVRRLATEAAAGGWQLAVASAGAEESVRAVLSSVMGRALSSRFTVIPGNDAAKKPAPDIYTRAVTELGRHPWECLAVEDNRNGLLAATGAGIPCLVTPTAVSRDHSFDEAELVLSNLGDPGGEQARRYGGRSSLTPGGHMGLADLAQLITQSALRRETTHHV